MARKLLFPLLVVALLFWAVGCSDNAADPNLNNEVNLDDEFGGYTATPESPGFGQDELLDEAGANEEYDDPMLVSPDVSTIVQEPNAEYYHMRILWGQLRYDSSVTDVTDWSGSLTISEGAEIIRRVIHFELGQDYIPTRTDRKVIEWVSYTTVHNDGIAVDLFVPPTYDTTWVEEVDENNDTTLVPVVDTILPDLSTVTVAFETGPYSRTFTLSELVALDTIVYLDDADSNAVAFHAFRLDRVPCPRGFLAGTWGFDEEGEGEFQGVWMNRVGTITGYLKGTYGKNSSGLNVFFGKWISSNGEFEGFLKGIYGQRPSPHANPEAVRHAGGWFAGKIYNAGREEIGVLKGRYRSAPNYQGGFFQGRWKLRCNDFSTDRSDYEEGF